MGRGPSEAEVKAATRLALKAAADKLGGYLSGEVVRFSRLETNYTASLRLIRASNGEAALVKRITMHDRPDVYVEGVCCTWDELYWELRNKQVKL